MYMAEPCLVSLRSSVKISLAAVRGNTALLYRQNLKKKYYSLSYLPPLASSAALNCWC